MKVLSWMLVQYDKVSLSFGSEKTDIVIQKPAHVPVGHWVAFWERVKDANDRPSMDY